MLSTTPDTWSLAVFAASDFDDRALLEDLLVPNLTAIRHINTNGANALVTSFALAKGIPHTVYPIGSRGLPASTRDILDVSDFAYIFATPDSRSAAQIATLCEKRAGNAEVSFGWRRIDHDPISHWRQKVCKAQEILACLSRDELKDSAWAKQVEGALE